MGKTLEQELLEDADFLDQTAENIEKDNPLNADELRGHATILRLRARNSAGKVLVRPHSTPLEEGGYEGQVDMFPGEVSAQGTTPEEMLVNLQTAIEEREKEAAK